MLFLLILFTTTCFLKPFRLFISLPSSDYIMTILTDHLLTEFNLHNCFSYLATLGKSVSMQYKDRAQQVWMYLRRVGF